MSCVQAQTAILNLNQNESWQLEQVGQGQVGWARAGRWDVYPVLRVVHRDVMN
jgi:hypothetical protein